MSLTARGQGNNSSSCADHTLCMHPFAGFAEERWAASVAPQQYAAHTALGQPEPQPAALGGLHMAGRHGHTR